jgi:putative transposase
MTIKVDPESMVITRPRPTKQKKQNMCLDKGYDYEEVRDVLREFGFTAHIRGRG